MSLAQVSQFPTSWYVLPSQSLLPGPLHSNTTSDAAQLLHFLAFTKLHLELCFDA